MERARAAVVAYYGPVYGSRVFKGVSPDLSDPATALRLKLGEDSRRAFMAAFGHELVFVDSDNRVNGKGEPVTALLSIEADGTCRREFVEMNSEPQTGDCVRVRGEVFRILLRIHPTG